MSSYYGVSQRSHGHEYRWIFEADVIHDRLGMEPEASEDIFFPISGSNASSTCFTPLGDEVEAVRYLLSAGECEYEDPSLADIGEYLLTIGSDDNLDDCTQYFLEKYGICDDAIINRNDDKDHHREKVLQMSSELKKAGYAGFDAENPFYGMDRDMKFSDLENLHKKVFKRKFREKSAKR